MKGCRKDHLSQTVQKKSINIWIWSAWIISYDQQRAALCRLTSSPIKNNQRSGCCQTLISMQIHVPVFEVTAYEWRALNGKFHTVWLNPSYMQWLCNTVAAGELCVSHLCRFHSAEQKHQPHKAAPLCGIYVDAQTGSLESKCRDETLVFEDNPQSYWDFLYPDRHLDIL